VVVKHRVRWTHSFYAADRGERERAVADNKLWINAAAASVLPASASHIASADNQPPISTGPLDTLLRIVEHAVTRKSSSIWKTTTESPKTGVSGEAD